MRISDINPGEYVLAPYENRAVKGRKSGVKDAAIGSFPSVRGHYRVKVLEVLPRGRVVVEEERWDWQLTKVNRRLSTAYQLICGEKIAVRKVAKKEFASRSLKPCEA